MGQDLCTYSTGKLFSQLIHAGKNLARFFFDLFFFFFFAGFLILIDSFFVVVKA